MPDSERREEAGALVFLGQHLRKKVRQVFSSVFPHLNAITVNPMFNP